MLFSLEKSGFWGCPQDSSLCAHGQVEAIRREFGLSFMTGCYCSVVAFLMGGRLIACCFFLEPPIFSNDSFQIKNQMQKRMDLGIFSPTKKTPRTHQPRKNQEIPKNYQVEGEKEEMETPQKRQGEHYPRVSGRSGLGKEKSLRGVRWV